MSTPDLARGVEPRVVTIEGERYEFVAIATPHGKEPPWHRSALLRHIPAEPTP